MTAAERYRAWAAKNAERLREYRRRYYLANRDRALEVAREWSAKNPDRAKEHKRRHAAKNVEHNRERSKKYRAANPDKCKAATANWRRNNAEHKTQLNQAWKASNPHKVAASRVDRRLIEARSCPPWADRDAISAIYRDAISCSQVAGEPYHVDHIVPLRSKFVSGLHCEANLRIVPGKENLRKGNRHWPDMP
jgi:hypothetical protein